MAMPESAPPPRIRYPTIDVLRGVALVAMAVYHFSWDLAYHGFVAWDVAGDPGWRAFAMAIAGSFLLISGVALSLAARGGVDPGAFAIRLMKIAGAAALVSLATLFLFPDTWIFFGILHMIAAGSLIGLLFLGLPVWVTALAALAVVLLPLVVSGGMFDLRPLLFLGLSSVPPVSNDFVPVFPWLAPVLAGIALGRLVAEGRIRVSTAPLRSAGARLLALMGRWSLPIYLLHQPLLFGLVWLAAMALPPDPAVERARFEEACRQGCGPGEAACAAFCGCVADALDGTPFFMTRGGDPSMSAVVSTAVAACSPGETPMP